MVVGNGSSAFRADRDKPSAVVGQAPLLRRILFRQSGEDRQLFQILLDRSCGRSPEHYALSTNYFLTGNPALRSKNGSILDAHVVRDSDLPANDDIILYHCAAGETCLRRDHNVLADIDVVSHMHQVIDFCAAANAGEVERAAIDGGIRADLHIFADNNPFLDHYIFSQFRGLVYDRARRNAWNAVALRAKPGSGTRKGEPRLGGD